MIFNYNNVVLYALCTTQFVLYHRVKNNKFNLNDIYSYIYIQYRYTDFNLICVPNFKWLINIYWRTKYVSKLILFNY